MAGLNKVFLIGNLGRDPEIRYTQQGTAVVNFSMATSEQWTDKNTGEKKEKVEWHKVVFWGKQAEVINQYLTKGSQVFVEGALQTRKWQDKDTGADRYTTEIKGINFTMLGGRNGGGQQNQGGGGYQQQNQGGGYQQNQNPGGGYQQQPNQQQQNQGGGYNPGNQYSGGPGQIPDDDIPF